jgi:hypothetical protein
MIYRRIVEKNGWKMGELAYSGESSEGIVLYSLIDMHTSGALQYFEKTDLTYEEAKLISIL